MTSGPAVSVELSVSHDAWLSACPEAEAHAEAAVRGAVSSIVQPVSITLIVGIILTDDAEQRELNRRFRGKDAPTNVLSFPIADPAAARPLGAPILLGDVVFAFETVAREAAEQHKPLPDHLSHLIVHGVLHLLGFDHESDAEAAVMEAREIEILKGLGVPAPYRDTM